MTRSVRETQTTGHRRSIEAKVGKTLDLSLATRLFEELVMRSAHWMMAAAMAAAPFCSAWAIEGTGLIPGGASKQWPRWQGRLSLASASPLLRVDTMNDDGSAAAIGGASLLSDYYFSRPRLQPTEAGGFRATSGVFLGTRSTSLLAPAPAAGFSGRAFSVDRRAVPSFALASGDVSTDSAAYMGLGYSSLRTRGGWGFSADVGVMALSPSSVVKLGRVVSGTQNLDDVLREMRLSPLLHLGVSYSF